MAKGLKGIMKQAQKMQQAMLKMQNELKEQEFTGTASGGMVTVKMNGDMQLLDVSIKPEAVDPDDVEMLEDLVMAAFQNAKEQVSAASESQMSGLNGPGMPSIPGL